MKRALWFVAPFLLVAAFVFASGGGGGSGGGGSGTITGPTNTTVNNVAAWGNTGGTSLVDTGVPEANMVLTSRQVIAGTGVSVSPQQQLTSDITVALAEPVTFVNQPKTTPLAGGGASGAPTICSSATMSAIGAPSTAGGDSVILAAPTATSGIAQLCDVFNDSTGSTAGNRVVVAYPPSGSQICINGSGCAINSLTNVGVPIPRNGNLSCISHPANGSGNQWTCSAEGFNLVTGLDAVPNNADAAGGQTILRAGRGTGNGTSELTFQMASTGAAGGTNLNTRLTLFDAVSGSNVISSGYGSRVAGAAVVVTTNGQWDFEGQVAYGSGTTVTPTGTTATLDWTLGNIQTLDLSSASGDVTVTQSWGAATSSRTSMVFVYLKEGSTVRQTTLGANWPGGAPTFIASTNYVIACMYTNAATVQCSLWQGYNGAFGSLTATSETITGGNFEITTGQAFVDIPSNNTPSGTTQTINWNSGNGQVLALGSASGNVTISFSNEKTGASYVLKITQGSTTRTVVWPGNVKWPAGVAPTLTAVSGATDVVSCFNDGTSELCSASLNYQ